MFLSRPKDENFLKLPFSENVSISINKYLQVVTFMENFSARTSFILFYSSTYEAEKAG